VCRFFCFWATNIAVQLYSASLYRLLGTTLRAIVFGVAVAVIVMLVTMLGSGFLILQDQLPHWLNWVFWFSPLQYAMTGMANNEYSGDSYDRLIPVGDDTQRLGDVVMRQYQMNIDNKYRCAPSLLLEQPSRYLREIM
jgi:ABC-2 type transporter